MHFLPMSLVWQWHEDVFIIQFLESKILSDQLSYCQYTPVQSRKQRVNEGLELSSNTWVAEFGFDFARRHSAVLSKRQNAFVTTYHACLPIFLLTAFSPIVNLAISHQSTREIHAQNLNFACCLNIGNSTLSLKTIRKYLFSETTYKSSPLLPIKQHNISKLMPVLVVWYNINHLVWFGIM